MFLASCFPSVPNIVIKLQLVAGASCLRYSCDIEICFDLFQTKSLFLGPCLISASVLYNLAAVHQPSKEPQLPCGTQLHNMLGAVIFGQSCGGCSCCYRCLSPPSHRRNRERRKLASDENYPLSTLTGAVHGKW